MPGAVLTSIPRVASTIAALEQIELGSAWLVQPVSGGPRQWLQRTAENAGPACHQEPHRARGGLSGSVEPVVGNCMIVSFLGDVDSDWLKPNLIVRRDGSAVTRRFPKCPDERRGSAWSGGPPRRCRSAVEAAARSRSRYRGRRAGRSGSPRRLERSIGTYLRRRCDPAAQETSGSNITIGAPSSPALPDNVRVRLELLDEHRFHNGLVGLHYRVHARQRRQLAGRSMR